MTPTSYATIWAVAVALIGAGCGPSAGAAPNAKLKTVVSRGIVEIQTPEDSETLHAHMVRTLGRLRAISGTTAAGRRVRLLAMRGFELTLCGVESRLSFTNNDSGNVEAATRDAVRSDRCFSKGARLLRAAALVLGFRAGKLKGY